MKIQFTKKFRADLILEIHATAQLANNPTSHLLFLKKSEIKIQKIFLRVVLHGCEIRSLTLYNNTD